MTHRCTQDSCFVDTTCALGHFDRLECEHWKAIDEVDEDNSTGVPESTSDVPWNGYSLGTSDLAILGGRGQPIVVGIVGPPDSGKTSLLAFVYMWLLKYGTLGEWQFAGSWTLAGWESIVRHSRWTGEPPPSFPPHTTSAGRHPGVLHVTLRHAADLGVLDVLFTDAPGEWFTQWSKVPGDPAVAGARWVIEHSDVLLLLIDSAALADADKLPKARQASRDLIERLAAKGRCNLAVVWTKDDVMVPTVARESVQRACTDFIPGAPVLKTTVELPATIEACFVRALTIARSTTAAGEPIEPQLSDDPFLAFRGINVDS